MDIRTLFFLWIAFNTQPPQICCIHRAFTNTIILTFCGGYIIEQRGGGWRKIAML
ncbi:hypothetical protein BDQ17DRAFT_813548 [Cyathus striatus]|nr:hypothetical protein BDQ17DRAFT_813548 [Cyathus striatus]